jgi:hypothetical protein
MQNIYNYVPETNHVVATLWLTVNGTLKGIYYFKILHYYHYYFHHHTVAIKWEYISGNPSQFLCLSVCLVTYYSYKLNIKSVTKFGRTEEVYLWQNSLNFSLQLLLEPFFIAQLHINIYLLWSRRIAEFPLRLYILLITFGQC